MYFNALDYPVVIIDADYESPRINGILIRALADEIRGYGHRVLSGLTMSDAEAGARTYNAASAVLISIDGEEEGPHQFDRLYDFLNTQLAYRENLPIFLYGERRTVEQIPTKLLSITHGFIFLYEDTKAFIAKQVMRAADEYMDNLMPPFFKALVHHAAESNYSWHTPGHGGGVAFTKSAEGRAFHQFFGENTFRSDLSVSVPELGSLLDHTGPVKAAETEAARNFGADHTFFVTNGTSTANKIVWHGTVARGDVVFVDRNCHKSLLHSLVMTGAVPVYFIPSRNAHGIIGPISLDQFDPKAMAKAIAANPLASKVAKAKGKDFKPKIAVVTNSTYDGLCYNVEKIAKDIGGGVDFLHFDEAWYGYAAFHEMYDNHYAMAKGKPRDQDPIIFATQSTHKLLAAFSQASMIHARNSRTRALDAERFNESFMMHTSTSPHYGIIASCDVASRMMEGRAGRSLIEQMHKEAIAFRRAVLHVGDDIKKGDWWFSVWQPDGLQERLDEGERAGQPVSTKQADWKLAPKAAWHGFGELARDYVMIDPIKVTLVMPGLTMDGKTQKQGIPAAVVSRFLWGRGITVEKTNLYSFLILFSMGITKGKWSTLTTELLAFKELYDANAPLSKALPSLVEENPTAYANTGLRELCDALHAFNTKNKVAQVMREMYVELPEPVLAPWEAYDRLVRGEVERVEIDKLAGRIAATMLVPYPPGIPVIMPGEKFGAKDSPIIESLRTAKEQNERFPGFESDIHGLIIEQDKDGPRYVVEVLKK
ncbi:MULTISPECIES: Orn/Lys/Arg decarboxylase N-terminal domain-containing protein [unclassified Dyella]|uniref:Orn/Lys/Arg family decarboxylase n=1 Tax=unclassified Dyella TaxID=2634549 RepID=UPI000C82B726|nr:MULTISPECIES: Orn/Lys/Arg decarboxylase N-terminal domain-containing protein [unclassified Dyella]MDR3447403.1 Orn/Lys/Arg decarboxylase N-terminal domain-containing protein [Dyella sp.]PMQ06190.1 Biodegradative arginine decarboxylase [Dyella sp. AD56]